MSDSLDKIFVSDGPVTPSTGFVRRVMAAVRRSPAFLPPIRFPWRRFAAGLGGAFLCTLVSTVVFLSMRSHDFGLPGSKIWADVSVWAGVSDALILSIPLIGGLLAVRVATELMSS